MGSMDAMFDYISLMSRVLLGKSHVSKKFPHCERNGVDQGVHNVLVHARLLPSAKVEYPDTFPVINMQSSPEYAPSGSSSTQLLNNNDKPFSIVHQYDRITTFQRALATKYVKWTNLADPVAEWQGDTFCSNFEKVMNVELFRGVCDLAGSRQPSAASCCEVCVLNKDVVKVENGQKMVRSCTGFTYVNGVCYMKSCSLNEIRGYVSRFRNNGPRSFDAPGATCAYMKLN
mmetsp:Transcript_24412/g.33498  ORF Transcript_24412/g.33498 Transcript_24412/m.33498 type:complete len:230 (-) Transcript_24412:50-739(-)